MTNWARKYIPVSVYDEPYLVEITRPAKWKPTKTANAEGQFPAEVVGTIPDETYELPYVKDSSVLSGKTDVWKLGPLFKASTERKAKLKVRNTSGVPDPLAYDGNNPVLRDGNGGGLDEGDFFVVIDKRKLVGKFRLISRKLLPGDGFTDPVPFAKGKVVKKKTTSTKRRK